MNTCSEEHFITPAEKSIMDAIDKVIGSMQPSDPLLIDYDFLREYTVSRLLDYYYKVGERAYVRMACTAVCVHRDFVTRRKIKKNAYYLTDVAFHDTFRRRK